jgi:hypothetical protein
MDPLDPFAIKITRAEMIALRLADAGDDSGLVQAVLGELRDRLARENQELQGRAERMLPSLSKLVSELGLEMYQEHAMPLVETNAWIFSNYPAAKQASREPGEGNDE